jgi:hypothetical protein
VTDRRCDRPGTRTPRPTGRGVFAGQRCFCGGGWGIRTPEGCDSQHASSTSGMPTRTAQARRMPPDPAQTRTDRAQPSHTVTTCRAEFVTNLDQSGSQPGRQARQRRHPRACTTIRHHRRHRAGRHSLQRPCLRGAPAVSAPCSWTATFLKLARTRSRQVQPSQYPKCRGKLQSHPIQTPNR